MAGKVVNFMRAGRFLHEKFGGQMPTKILIVYRFPLVFQALKALM